MIYNIKYTRESGRVVSEKRGGAYALTKHYGYNSDGDLESTKYVVNEQELGYTYETDNTPDKRNHNVTLPFGIAQHFVYDGLGRTREIALGENLVKDISYIKRGDHATNRVSTEWFGVNGIRKDSLRYTYDKAGNIETVTENGIVVAEYAYDGLNRLIREKSAQFGNISYEYDSAGNIVCKTVNGTRYEYSYPQSGWKDQMLSFNGELCEYDALGNPTTYRGRTLAWRGRRLISYGKDGKQATFTYDPNGVRTSKTVKENGVERSGSKYIYDGNNLIAEQRDGEWIYYIYGTDGIAGFRYNSTTYLYRKNVQGDITHIYTENGQQVAHYAYDAWGNVKELQPESGISKLNPFRYRGYYYDVETGLYYLQTRYYDPETGRFISSDSIEYLDPETLGGLNLYAYCGNNPVMNVDPTGSKWWEFWKWDWKKIGGWVLTGLATVASVGLIVVGTVVTGGLLSAVLVGAGIGALVGISGSIILQGGINNSDPWEILKDGGIGAGIGAFSGAFSYGVGVIGSYIGQSIGSAFANATHLASGVKFGEIFGAANMMGLGKFMGEIVGGLIGGTFANYFANKFFGKNLSLIELIKQGIDGEVPMWIINFFKSL